MARTRKRPRPAPSARPRPDLSDWQGFRARRRSPRFRWLVAGAIAAAASTLVLSQFRDQVGRLAFDLWIFSLVALQVLIVVESDEFLRGGLARAVPVASAFALAAFCAFALHAGTTAAFVLAAAMLAIAFLPPSWHARLLAAIAAGA
jgi:hypothetical protein